MISIKGNFSRFVLTLAVTALFVTLALSGCGSGGDATPGGSAVIPATGTQEAGQSASSEQSSASNTPQPAATPEAALQMFFGALQAGDRVTLETYGPGLQTWGGFGLQDVPGRLTFSDMAYQMTANDTKSAVVHVHGYMVYKDPSGAYTTKYAINGDSALNAGGGSWTIWKLPEYKGPDYQGRVPSID